jgi:hypothetical protein
LFIRIVPGRCENLPGTPIYFIRDNNESNYNLIL